MVVYAVENHVRDESGFYDVTLISDYKLFSSFYTALEYARVLAQNAARVEENMGRKTFVHESREEYARRVIITVDSEDDQRRLNRIAEIHVVEIPVKEGG